MYNYEIINFWNDQDDLYVQYIVEDTTTNEKVNTIGYYNTADIECDYNMSSYETIQKHLLNILEKNNGVEFNIPKVSELSSLLKYVYDSICESESNMFYVDYDEWEELKDSDEFTKEDFNILKKEIKKYNLEDVISIDDKEYKICAYGMLQTIFNDDREKDNFIR